MTVNRKMLAVLAVAVVLLVTIAVAGSGLAQPTPIEQLGEHLYFDTNLSEPNGQSCASCHDPDFGFVDPDSDLPVSQGVLPELRFGNRNSPSSAYAMYAPEFHWDPGEGLWFGGQFWDGRATGEVLGDPLADQALGPFLNPLEMNNPLERTVIKDIQNSDYADLFVDVCGGEYGERIFKNIDAAYDCVAESIAAFERTALFAQFTSRYDEYLSACLDAGGSPDDCAQGIGDAAAAVGPGILGDLEWEGLLLFIAENDNDGVLEEGEGGMCAACHVADWTEAALYPLPVQVPSWAPEGMVPPVFTDFSFDNLGVPKNPDNPFYHLPPPFNPDGLDFVDYGLGGFLKNRGEDPSVYQPEMGKVKVMTLRNIGITGPYMHNGFFTDLETVVDFYSSRDMTPWPEPEVLENVNDGELGSLGLGDDEIAAIAAFMETLTDGEGEP